MNAKCPECGSSLCDNKGFGDWECSSCHELFNPSLSKLAKQLEKKNPQLGGGKKLSLRKKVCKENEGDGK